MFHETKVSSTFRSSDNTLTNFLLDSTIHPCSLLFQIYPNIQFANTKFLRRFSYFSSGTAGHASFRLHAFPDSSHCAALFATKVSASCLTTGVLILPEKYI